MASIDVWAWVAVFILFVVLTYVLVRAVVNLIFEIIEYRLLSKAKRTFFNKLRKLLKQGAIKDLEDVISIRSSVARRTKSFRFVSVNLARLLEDFKLEIPEKEVKNTRDVVNALINQARVVGKFSVFPESEQELTRRLLKNKRFEELIMLLGEELRKSIEERENAKKRMYQYSLAGALIGLLSLVLIVIEVLL